MRIAVFIKKTTLHQGYGGLETQNKVLCEGLVGRGHEVVVFSPKWELSQTDAEENNIRYIFVDCVYRMGPVLGFFGTWQASNWINRSVEEFTKVHEKGRFDLALAQSSSGLGVIKQKQKLDVRVISISHGSILGEYKTFLASMELPRDLILLIKNTGFTIKNFFRRQREFVHGSDKVIAVSNFVKQSLLDETYTFDEKITVIHNGIDPEGFYQHHKDLTRDKTTLFVGQMIKSKGAQDLLKIFKHPEMKEYALDLIGEGELLEDLKDEIKDDDNLGDRIRFLGKIQHSELIEKYYKDRRYGLLAMPTKRYEGFPMTLVEAMFSGLPTVAYEMGGVVDAVQNGENGFLIEPNNLSTFKEKMLEILKDDKLRSKMSRRSLELAYENFKLEDMIDKYESVMQEVIK